MDPGPDSKATDFDFLVGCWRVRHRRLKERLVGDTRWEEFGGSSEQRMLLDGRGNVDDCVVELPAGAYRAVTLRSFDPESRQWAIWWLDGRSPHQIDVPMIGGFSGGVGTFYADELFKGRPIRVRFLWSGITPDACRWEQAFSADEGRTWEINWVMEFSRAT